MDDQPAGVADHPHDIIHPREQPLQLFLGAAAAMSVPDVAQDQTVFSAGTVFCLVFVCQMR